MGVIALILLIIVKRNYSFMQIATFSFSITKKRIMKKLLLIAILGLTNISFLYAADDRNVVNAELKSVTVYKS